MHKRKIPMIGNPPRVQRAQKVIAKLEKDPRPLKPHGVITGPDDLVRDVLADYIGGRATEVFLVLYVDVRNRVVGFDEYNEGSVAAVTVNTSAIMRNALISGAAAFVTVHQHPSGDPTPSDEDRALWRRVREASSIIGIACLDNLVIGDDGRYFSEGNGRVAQVMLRSRAASTEAM